MRGTPKAVLVLALATTGCSFMFVRPSAVQPLEAASCSDSVEWPVVDALVAGALVSATAYAATHTDQGSLFGDGPAPDKENVVIGLGFPTAVFAASAVAGFSRVQTCREAKAAQAGVHGAPTALVPVTRPL
jgi:hypothetical protein